MKKKILSLCSVVIALSICFAVFSVNCKSETDITTATVKTFYAEKNETTTDNAIGGFVNGILGEFGSAAPSDKVDGILGSIEGVPGDIEGAIGNFGDSLDGLGGIGDSLGGIGDIFGGVGSGLGDSLGGILGGLGGSGSGSGGNITSPAPTTSADIGLIIPVPAATQTQTETQALLAPVESTGAGETVDYAVTSNPYPKPTASFAAGDEDETIKWIQWIFVYTGYGLKADGITGVLDEDTVAVIKKLQHENKLTVDGNINEDVIKAAEVLYYQSIIGGDASAIEVSSDATTGASVSNPADNNENGNNIPVALLIVVLVIIWVLAIGGIVLLFVFKKKKINASNQNAEEKNIVEEKENKNTEIRSLSDLFEEAEKDK